MIISRTPFRVSFVGGGTDLKEFWEKEDGAVLSTSIDKYIYVTIKKHLGFVKPKYRIAWSKLEYSNSIDEIEHPIIREALRLLKIDDPLEITTFADVPASTGLGSSSSFTVGLLNALYALKGEIKTKKYLAEEAAHIEINILGRPIGKQDHYAAAFGNFNIITFKKDGSTLINPVVYTNETIKRLQDNLMLFYTFQTRDAASVLTKQKEVTANKFNVLKNMRDLVPELHQAISNGNIDHFGKLLHHNWLLKKSITPEISNNSIDKYYETAMQFGATGGKLLGAGGGGFLLFYVPKENREKVHDALSEMGLYEMKFNYDTEGTKIVYYEPN